MNVNLFSDGSTQLDKRMGVGAIPSRIPTPNDLGHMWLYWESQHQGQSCEYRGFYPLINRIPDEFQPINRWREFFFNNSALELGSAICMPYKWKSTTEVTAKTRIGPQDGEAFSFG